MKYILIITVLLCVGCGSAITPQMIAVAANVADYGLKKAAESDKELPYVPKECVEHWETGDAGITYDVLVVQCSWHVPKDKQ